MILLPGGATFRIGQEMNLIEDNAIDLIEIPGVCSSILRNTSVVITTTRASQLLCA